MRIVLLTTDAYGAVGGIAAYNRDLIEALATIPEVDEVVVIARTATQVSGEPPPPKARVIASASGSKVRFVGAVLRHGLERTDLLLCGHINLLPVAAPLRLALRCPMVLLAYGIDVWQPPRPSIRMWLRQVNSVWSISAVTRDRMNSWANLPQGAFTLLPNAIRVDRFGVRPKPVALAQRYGLCEKQVLLTLGRLSSSERYKGVDEVLNVMPGLLEDNRSLAYLVVGDGDDRPRLQRKAENLGIAARVVFAGAVQEAEKVDHYALADVFVMPSRGEGFGFVFLEAMACGVPVVGSTADGSREALRDGVLGDTVDPDDQAALSKAIRKALTKKRSVPDGLSFFHWVHFVERLTNELQRACAPSQYVSRSDRTADHRDTRWPSQ